MKHTHIGIANHSKSTIYILVAVSVLAAMAVCAQESKSDSQGVPDVEFDGGTFVTPPPESPVEVQPGVDFSQAEMSDIAPDKKAYPPESENNQAGKDVRNTGIVQNALSASGNAAESKISFVDLIPWGLAIFMAALAGAATTYVWIMKKQERHFTALRENILNGSKSVHLLPEEATRIIRDFSEMVREGAGHFDKTVKQQRAELEKIVQMAEDTSRLSREDAQRTVDNFKGSLNEMLGKISKFMERVVHDTKETHNQALETKEFTKQVSALIHEKEAEILKLKEGYHLQLISPLTKAFLKIRDDIYSLANHTGDPQIRQQLLDLDQQIGHALLDLQIEEIPIEVGEKPHEIHHSRLWESLGAAVPTDDPERHGAVAGIQERGYQFQISNGESHIIRKAVVVILSCSSANAQSEEEIIASNK